MPIFSRSLTDMVAKHSDLITFIPGGKRFILSYNCLTQHTERFHIMDVDIWHLIRSIPFFIELFSLGHLISYVIERVNGKVKSPGKVLIRDRNILQSQILPLYFNRASFDTFRRQLCYFSFVRLTKGRKSTDITYTNGAVVELSDILRLKRKLVVNSSSLAFSAQTRQQLLQLGKPKEESQESSRDLALAVTLGKMHACEANNDLDTENYTEQSLAKVQVYKKTRAGIISGKVTSNKENREAKSKSARKNSQSRVMRFLIINEIVPFLNFPAPEFQSSFRETCHPRRIHCSNLSFNDIEPSTILQTLSNTTSDSSGDKNYSLG